MTQQQTPTPDRDWPVALKAQPRRRAPSTGSSTPPLVSDTEDDADRASSSGGTDDTPSPVTQTRALSPFPLFDPDSSPLYATCKLGTQAFERWQAFFQLSLSYDSSPYDSAPDSAGEHYDHLVWPPRITFQESQLRSTS